MGNLNGRYSEILDFLNKISTDYCKHKQIKINIIIPDEDKLNAGVKKIREKEYRMKIYSSCLNLSYRIEKITERYGKDDLQHFFRFKQLSIFQKYEEDTYREELDNMFSTIILLHIFWHEIGHIEAGFADRLYEYVEFDSNENGCFLQQEQEMVADWLSTKKVFDYIYDTSIKGKVRDSEELIIALKQLVELCWLSLTIQFQIFESNHKGIIPDASTLTHPYPEVRLMYCLEAMAESIVDVFNTYGMNDEEAEEGMKIIVNDSFCIIQSFLMITDSPIDVKKDEIKVIEYYKKLRELPYSDDYEANDLIHLLPLNEDYLKLINSFLQG